MKKLLYLVCAVVVSVSVSQAQSTTSPVGCSKILSQAQYTTAKNSIAKKNDDASKQATAKQVVNASCAYAEQVKGFESLFTSEQTKLDFAIYAYAYCYDQSNYYAKVSPVLSSESVRQLHDYMYGTTH